MNSTIERTRTGSFVVPEIENDLTRRRFLAGTGSLLVLGAAGCGNGEDTGNGEETSGETRAIEHAMGKAEVLTKPRRVVALGTGELDSVIALGFKPLGAVTGTQESELPRYLADDVEGVENVGTSTEPNLETVAALKPDLVLGSKSRFEGIYDELSQIAPTVLTETNYLWKENFRLHAEALNKSEQAGRMMEEYYGRAKEFQRRMGERLEETEVSVVRFMSGQARIYMKDSFAGTVLEDAGLPRPPTQDKDEIYQELAEESIPDLEGDVLFWTVYGPAEKTPVEDVTGDRLWAMLDVIRRGRAYKVRDDYWMLSPGILSANLILDDLSEYLVEETTG